MSKNWFFFKKKILIFFSIKSFNDVEIWIKNLRENSSPDIKIILIGNKCDLEERVVSKEDGEKLKNDYDFDYFIETSAKTGLNAKNVFIQAAKLLYTEHLEYKDRATRPGSLAEFFNKNQKFRIYFDDIVYLNSEIIKREKELKELRENQIKNFKANLREEKSKKESMENQLIFSALFGNGISL